MKANRRTSPTQKRRLSPTLAALVSPEVQKPDPKLKGKYNGNCNRTACQKPGATWFNLNTSAFYCASCGMDINRACERDHIDLYGTKNGVFNADRRADGEVVARRKTSYGTMEWVWDATAKDTNTRYPEPTP